MQDLRATCLLIKVGERYGFGFASGEGPQNGTVGDLIEICRQRILARQSPRCIALVCFRKLQRLVRDVCEAPEKRLRPSTKLSDLTPRQRQQLWRRVESEFPIELLKLVRPPALRKALHFGFGLAVLLTLILLFLAWSFDRTMSPADACSWSCVLVPMYLLLAAIFASYLRDGTEHLRTEPPPELTTLGDLTRVLTGLYVARTPPLSAEPDAILAELRPLICFWLEVQPAQVELAARFAEDLGIPNMPSGPSANLNSNAETDLTARLRT